ncbi:hypothetical protein [Microbulbifer sp. JMSA003]|uniref:hypothetical protein n=1 Tax=Microbulbifer sp. JMSA003 TaxID=3243369 RepID=UPI004039C14A
MITPIMLRSFGRSGSTLLMQVLGSSSNVVFDRDYPFEKRHLTYLHRLTTVASSESCNDENWNADSLFSSKINRIGPIPYINTSIIDREKLQLEFLTHLWKGFSGQIKDKLKEELNLDEPIYYAEKVVHDICPAVNEAFYAKNLFLFRDPRDEFVSIKSFNAKRGFNGFGWGESDDDESYALKLCQMRKTFMQHISSIEASDRRYVVKYEEFIKSPYEITSFLGDWIGLELDYGKVEAQKKSVEHHITSSNVAASVERWRTEMSPKVAQIFEKEIGEELSELGYGL